MRLGLFVNALWLALMWGIGWRARGELLSVNLVICGSVCALGMLWAFASALDKYRNRIDALESKVAELQTPHQATAK